MEVLRSERGSSKGRLRVTQSGDEAGARLAGARHSVRGGCVQLGMVSRGMVVASEVEVARMAARCRGEMAVKQLVSATSSLGCPPSGTECGGPLHTTMHNYAQQHQRHST